MKSRLILRMLLSLFVFFVLISAGLASVVPSNWTCASEHYDSNDGCDCFCGARDPDCEGSEGAYVVYGQLSYCPLASVPFGAYVYISTLGSDSTGAVGNPQAPFATVNGAVLATYGAIPIVVLPGRYHGPGNQDIYMYMPRTTIMSVLGPAYTIFDCNATSRWSTVLSTNLTIDGVQVKNCIASSASSTFETTLLSASPSMATAGGALRIVNTNNPNMSVEIRNTWFFNNFAEAGSAVYFAPNVHYGVLRLCLFFKNLAAKTIGVQSLYGGAVYFRFQTYGEVNRCNFTQNEGSEGVLVVQYMAKALVTDSLFERNYAPARCTAFYSSTNTEFRVVNTNFISNTGAGGTACSWFENIFIENCTFLNNFQSTTAGAFLHGGTNMVINNSRIIGSKARTGGAISMVFATPLRIYNTLFKNNEAVLTGGTIFMFENSYVYAQNVTWDGERALQGAAFFTLSGTIYCFGCTFRNLYATGEGGCFYLGNAQLRVQNSVFENNYAGASGGSIYVINTQSSLTITSSKFVNNSAGEFVGIGGAVFVNAQTIIPTTIINSTFYSNSAFDRGGAIAISNNATVYLSGLQCRNNSASSGGCMWVGGTASVEIRDSDMDGNRVDDSGGGIFIEARAVLRIFKLRCRWNSVRNSGGCITMEYNTTTVLTDSLLADNVANIGGAMSVSGLKNASVILTGTSITRNIARAKGGGLSIMDAFAAIDGMSIFTNNTATQTGGAIHYENGHLSIQNASMAGNVAGDKGGGLYARCDETIPACWKAVDVAADSQLVFTSDLHMNLNQGKNGGGAFFYDVVPTSGADVDLAYLCSNCEYSGNTASYGQVLGTPTWYLESPISTTSSENSGDTVSPVLLELKDALRQVIKSQSDSLVQAQAYSDGAVLKGLVNVPLVTGQSVFTELVVVAQPGGAYAILFSHQNSGAHTLIEVPLRPCYRGEVQPASSLQCKKCPSGTYSLLVGNATKNAECKKCPVVGSVTAADCEGDEIRPIKGFWKSTFNEERVLQCVNDACTGNSTCADGYGGNLCAVCQAGYGKTGTYGCSKCPTLAQNLVLMFAALLVLMVFAISMIRSARKSKADDKGHTSVMIKIFTNYIQIIGMSQAFDLPWPEVLSNLFKSTEGAGNPIATIVSFDCLLTSSSQLDRLQARVLFYFLLPIGCIIIPALVLGCCIAGYKARGLLSRGPDAYHTPDDGIASTVRKASTEEELKQQRNRRGSAVTPKGAYEGTNSTGRMAAAWTSIEGKWHALRNRRVSYLGSPIKSRRSTIAVVANPTSANTSFYTAVVVLLFLVHPMVSREILSLFDCRDLKDGKHFLKVALDHECFTAQHYLWMFVFGLPGIFLYGIGIPTAGFCILYFNRKDLKTPKFTSMFSFLYRGYRSRYYYWELVIMCRKLLVVAISVFLGSKSQVQALLAMIVLMSVVLMEAFLLPFYSILLNVLDLLSLLVCLFTVYAGMFFYAQNSGEVATEDLQTLTFSVLILNAIFISIFGLIFILEAFGILRKYWPRLAGLAERRATTRKVQSLAAIKADQLSDKEASIVNDSIPDHLIVNGPIAVQRARKPVSRELLIWDEPPGSLPAQPLGDKVYPEPMEISLLDQPVQSHTPKCRPNGIRPSPSLRECQWNSAGAESQSDAPQRLHGEVRQTLGPAPVPLDNTHATMHPLSGAMGRRSISDGEPERDGKMLKDAGLATRLEDF